MKLISEPVQHVYENFTHVDEFSRELLLEIDGYTHHIGRIKDTSEETMMEYLAGAFRGDPKPEIRPTYWEAV